MPYCCYTVFGKSHAPTSKANGYWVLGIGFVVVVGSLLLGYHLRLHLLLRLISSIAPLLYFPLLLNMTSPPSRPMASSTSPAAGEA